MKKRLKFLILFFSIIFVVLMTIFFCSKSKRQVDTVENFDLKNFQYEIEHFPSEMFVGEVKNKKDVIEKANVIWLEKYKVDAENSFEEIKVEYDLKEKCWHIFGVKSKDYYGGVLHTLIRENGEVIAVWFED